MKKNEYFSNCYKAIITNKIVHIIISLLEFILTLITQSIVFYTKYIPKKLAYKKFSFSVIHIILKLLYTLSESTKLIIIIIIYILTIIYYLLFNKYPLKEKYIYNTIIINIFEVFIFRLFFLIICYIALSIDNLIYLVISFLLIIIVAVLLKFFKKSSLLFFPSFYFLSI